jgi:hypothetical protein
MSKRNYVFFAPDMAAFLVIIKIHGSGNSNFKSTYQYIIYYKTYKMLFLMLFSTYIKYHLLFNIYGKIETEKGRILTNEF